MQNEIIKVNDKQVVAVEWNGERVITTAQLAEVYGTLVDNVKRNFNRNANKFKEGMHYYLLEGSELKDFKNQGTTSPLVAKNSSHLYLWTRRGASRHCKILDTEKAWEQFDCLEEAYFNPKPVVSTEQLSPELQMFGKIFESVAKQELRQKEQDKRIAELQEKTEKQTEVMQAVKETLIDAGAEEDFQQWARKAIGEIANSAEFSCSNYRYQEAWAESYKRLTAKASCNLDTLVKNAQKRATEAGASKTKIKAISKLSVISDNKRLREIYISVIREMMVAFCVEVA